MKTKITLFLITMGLAAFGWSCETTPSSSDADDRDRPAHVGGRHGGQHGH